MKQDFVNVDNNLRIRYLETAADKSDLIIAADGGRSSAFGRINNHNRRHVLFIHGLGSSADRWLDIPDALSLSNLHTVAIDLPGFGWSDKPADMDYTIGKFVEVTVEFMHKIGIATNNDKNDNYDDNHGSGGNISIVGHSLGGYVAAQLAIEHRHLVDRLVLVDSSGMLNGATPILQQYLEAAMNPSKESVKKVFEQLVADPLRIPDVLVEGFIYRIKQPNAQHAFKSAFDNSVGTQIGADRLKLIRDYNIPTMIMWGSEDRLIPLQYFYVFKEAIGNLNATTTTIIVKDAGHAPFAEKPAIVCELLRRFLA